MMYHLHKGKFLDRDVLRHELIPDDSVHRENDGTYTLNDFTTDEHYMVQYLTRNAKELLIWRITIPLDNLKLFTRVDIIHSFEEQGDIVVGSHKLRPPLLIRTYIDWSYIPLDQSLTHIHAKVSMFPDALYYSIIDQLRYNVVVYGTTVYHDGGCVVDIRDWRGDQPVPLEFGMTLWQLYRPLLRGP